MHKQRFLIRKVNLIRRSKTGEENKVMWGDDYIAAASFSGLEWAVKRNKNKGDKFGKPLAYVLMDTETKLEMRNY